MFNMNDVVSELYDEFPELEPKAIDKICKDGLSGLLKLMRRKEEVIVNGSDNKTMKFYFPTTPEKQSKLTLNNIRRRQREKEKKQDGKTSK